MMRIRRKTLIPVIVVAALALAALAVVPALAANGTFRGGWGGMMGRGANDATTGATSDDTAGVCPGGGVGVASDVVTKLLGMTQDEIVTQLKAGSSLAQIAAGKGVAKADLVNAIIDARKTVLQQAVTDNRITQAQMDQMIQRMTERVNAMVDSTSLGTYGGRGKGMMGRGFGGGCGGRGGWGDPANGTPSTTSSQI
jgi:hypothetical protein